MVAMAILTAGRAAPHVGAPALAYEVEFYPVSFSLRPLEGSSLLGSASVCPTGGTASCPRVGAERHGEGATGGGARLAKPTTGRFPGLQLGEPTSERRARYQHLSYEPGGGPGSRRARTRGRPLVAETCRA